MPLFNDNGLKSLMNGDGSRAPSQFWHDNMARQNGPSETTTTKPKKPSKKPGTTKKPSKTTASPFTTFKPGITVLPPLTTPIPASTANPYGPAKTTVSSFTTKNAITTTFIPAGSGQRFRGLISLSRSGFDPLRDLPQFRTSLRTMMGNGNKKRSLLGGYR